jgi:hypothetical protein
MVRASEATLTDRGVVGGRSRFLNFVLGTNRLPQKFDQRLTIAVESTASVNHLPRARTCVFKLFLPPYPTKEKLLEKLRIAICENTFSAQG